MWSFFAISGILLLIALSNRFAVYLAKAATGELPLSLVLRLVWLYTPELLSFVIPLQFLPRHSFCFWALVCRKRNDCFIGIGLWLALFKQTNLNDSNLRHDWGGLIEFLVGAQNNVLS